MTPADDPESHASPDDEGFDAWSDEARPPRDRSARPAGANRNRKRRRRRRRRSRQTIALAVAAGLGSLVVAGVLLATLFAGKDAPKPPTQTLPQTPVVTSTTAPLPRILDDVDLNPAIPTGDYAPFCTAVRRQLKANAKVGPSTPGSPLAKAAAVYLRLDFDQLERVAPDGLKPALGTVGDGRETVARVLGQVRSLDELEPADLPEGWLDALILVSKATEAYC